jgi:hypothetical protein
MLQIFFLLVNVFAYGLLLYWLVKFWKVLKEEFGVFPVVLAFVGIFSLLDFKKFQNQDRVWTAGVPAGKAYTLEAGNGIFRNGTLYVFSDARDTGKVAQLKYVETGFSAFRTRNVLNLDYLPGTHQAYLQIQEEYYLLGLSVFKSIDKEYYALR